MPDMQKKHFPAKKVFIIVIISLTILLPTILAVFNILTLHNDKAKNSLKIHTVVLYDENGNELAREMDDDREHGDSSLISIFSTINDSKIPVEKIADNVVTEAPITATLISQNKTVELTCYFSFTEGASFCIDTNGIYFKIPAQDSERFLISEFSEILYKESHSPVLSSADGDAILPRYVNWNYQNIQNDYIVSKHNKSTEELLTYHVTGNISLLYDIPPDNCYVEIHNGTETFFSGDLASISSLKLDSSTLLTVEISASWNQKNGSRAYGNMDYEFNVIIHKRAEFYLDKKILDIGEFATLHATNIADISRLAFSSETLDFEPQFTLIGEDAYALIPCPSATNVDEIHTFTVSYGVASETFSITVTEQTAMRQNSLSNAFSQSTLHKEANEQINAMFFNGKILDISQYGFTISEQFGNRNNENPNFSTKFITQNGYGMPVHAVGAGKVIYVGNSESYGTYVIIDSGLGIRFCYSRLSSSDVSVGRTVSIGEIIGKTGQLSFGNEGFSLTVSVSDTVLDYEKITKETQKNG